MVKAVASPRDVTKLAVYSEKWPHLFRQFSRPGNVGAGGGLRDP
jgi:hypothetical protein